MKSLLFGWIAGLIIINCSACQAKPTRAAVAHQPGKTAQVDQEWWVPQSGQSFQVQFEGEIDLTVDVDIMTLDLFETSGEDVSFLQDRGVKVLCYLNAGAWENWRPDREAFSKQLLGRFYQGWPGERWLDIRDLARLEPLLSARLDLCAAKGFDGVEPDNLDGYLNPTGFDLSPEDQLAFNRWLAQSAHARGLGIGLKNDPEQAQALAIDFDWVVAENCFKQGWCQQLDVFVQAGKPIFAIEYRQEGMRLEDFCPQAEKMHIDAILKNRNLDAWLAACP